MALVWCIAISFGTLANSNFAHQLSFDKVVELNQSIISESNVDHTLSECHLPCQSALAPLEAERQFANGANVPDAEQNKVVRQFRPPGIKRPPRISAFTWLHPEIRLRRLAEEHPNIG